MRKYFLSALLCMVQIASYAQKINGMIVDEKGKALQNTSIYLTGKDSLACISDSKGLFFLDCGKNTNKKMTLQISHIGYKPLEITIDGDSEEMNLGKLTLKKDSYNLKEVTVTAAAKQQVDRTLHYPSEKMKASANDGFELVNKMMLPGVVVDLADKSFSMLNRQTVLLYINDKPASKTDVMSLRPTDVIRIEFIDSPGAEYGFDVNVGCVIKFVVKHHNQGYAIGLQSLNAFTTLNGQNFAYAKYYKGMSELTLSAGNNYSSVHRRNTSEYNEYHLDKEPHIMERDGLNTKLSYSSTDVDLTYNLTKPEKYIIELSASGSFYDAPNRGNKQVVKETGTETYFSFNKNTEHYFKPVINLFHKMYMGNHQTLTSNAVYTIIDTDYGYYLNEYTDESMTKESSKYGYDTDGLKHSLIMETMYMNRLGKTTWTSGARYTYGDVKNTYKGYSNATNRMYDNNAYFYSQIGGQLWKKMSYLLGLGASYQYTKQGDLKSENWILRPIVTLQMPISKVYFRYTFMVSPTAPSLSNLSNTIQQENTYEYTQGNPNLKMNSYYINRLSASVSVGKLYIQNTTRYNYAHHPVMSEISITEMDDKKAFIHSVANQKSFTYFSDNLSVQYNIIPDMLSVQGNLGYNHYQTIANSYHHYLNDVTGMIQADMYFGKWSMGARWTSASKSLSSENIYKESANNNVYINYRLGQLRIGLMGKYLFQKNGITQPELLINKNLKKSLTLRVPSFGNMVMVALVWNFQKGKSHKSEENSFSNSDDDSGILKM